MNLFHKAACFTDIHYGAKSNSEIHNQDCLDFTKWFIEVSKQQNCETCIILGDYHNNRSTINTRTLDYMLKGFELLSTAFENTYIIQGNHDLFFKDKRDISSIKWASHIKNIHVIEKVSSIGNVTLCPWLVGDEWKLLNKISGKYIFGHFELPSFFMNSLVQMPDHGEISLEQFQNYELGFSGHFHKRQNRGNMHYIGNAFPHNYADTWDDDRGMMILEWGGQPEYHAWPNQPTFRTVKLSQLIDDADKILKPKQHLRVTLDIDISFEEASFIKEKYVGDYRLRELTLIAEKKAVEINTDIDVQAFESIDTIVANQIVSIESDTFNKNTLLEIYNGL
jgi:DNA repair exonuclease SbcCD nuclease subunit